MVAYSLHRPQKRLLLIRHGQAGDPGSKRYIGQTDIRLTELGRSQAEALSRWLAPVPIERIVCSDLSRCRDSAAIIAAPHGLQIEEHPGLREISLGAWEGVPMARIQMEDPEAFRRRGRDLAGFRPPGGESFADLKTRVAPVYRTLLAQAAGNTVVVGHAGVHRVMLCSWLGLPMQKIFFLGQDPGNMSIVEPTAAGTVRLAALNVLPSRDT